MSWILFLSAVGIALVCLELFVPGMVVGILGAFFLLGAVGVTYAKYGAMSGNMALGGLLIASAVLLMLWLTIFPKTGFGRHVITHHTLREGKSADSLDGLQGKEGRAITPLRPAGTALIDGRRVDVLAESGMIDQDQGIHVARVEGNRVFVRKTV